MSLKRKRPETLPATLRGKLQGEALEVKVTYHNRKLSELQEVLDTSEDATEAVLFVVKEIDSEYPLTKEGLVEMEDDCPGMTLFIMAGFHEARAVQKAKN